ncbi:Glycosyltransferases-like protein [Vibrio coralliirubri]|uniref:glycosyltransferase family 2 protein n=1 Tax=Vibrio coralliirubri TaxID=1516159 RepID=UPI000632E41A|nr:glycosyltransferase family 2 protein [Vibrio coralliirubri]CDT39157.1 Glycosyltransferases-like protein [Vibrio coralliirubri]
MKLYISVVSHLHNDILIQLDTLMRLSKHPDIIVIFRDNIPTQKLKHYCDEHGIHYVSNKAEKGFSTNNNLNFLLAESGGMKSGDYFVALNPDVYICESMINNLVNVLKQSLEEILVPNLYLNKEKTLFDDNLRQYPKFTTFIRNYLLGDRSTVIDKSKPVTSEQEFWCSGAFLIVKAHLYKKLKGFDEAYYMYCEDIDFCRRARLLGHTPQFLPQIEAVHFRRVWSRKFLSKAFFRHVKSVIRYSFGTHSWRKQRSSISICDYSEQSKSNNNLSH